jgi:UDP-N-acetylmuramoyl-tripeptide--D-alanyl-D-alanine ligase
MFTDCYLSCRDKRMQTPELYQKYLETGKVSTDTRKITPDSVFFALRGPAFNGNTFAQEALAKGACYAVVDDSAYATDSRCILVPDVLLALQDLARHHRNQLNIPVIGLTGSNGKTTSKELVYVVLSTKFRTYATQGNLNNHIGVPVTVLSIDKSHNVAIVEMGANHLGEIELLCSICQPTHGFITNIGKAHIGTFGGFENIIRGKSELYHYLLTHDGTVFINSQNPILSNMAKRFKEPLLYPAQGDYYHCELIEQGHYLTVRTESGARIQTHLTGHYNFENVAVALAIGKFFGVDGQKAHAAIAAYVPGNMRSQVITRGTNTIILDAYNANPTSMEAAIENLAVMPGRRKVAILGDMYELEETAGQEHARIGELLVSTGIAEAYFCGPLMAAAKETFPAGKYFSTREELAAELKARPITDAVVLIKASRGMAMEKVVEYL